LHPSDQLDEPVPEGVKLGHVHLYVANLRDSMHFYRDVLGFEELSMLSRWRAGDVTLNGYLPISLPSIPGRAKGLHRPHPTVWACSTLRLCSRTRPNWPASSSASSRRT
jgi:catechol 2,3-dioxygenase